MIIEIKAIDSIMEEDILKEVEGVVDKYIAEIKVKKGKFKGIEPKANAWVDRRIQCEERRF